MNQPEAFDFFKNEYLHFYLEELYIIRMAYDERFIRFRKTNTFSGAYHLN